MVTTSKDSWGVAIDAILGNPYRGHTLQQSLQQTKRITGWQPPGPMPIVTKGIVGSAPRFRIAMCI
jgi:hypothetical protein